jgi:hypothetical protein
MSASEGSGDYEDSRVEYPMVAFGLTLLRWRRVLIYGMLLGGFIGALSGLFATRLYESNVTFIPQASEGGGAASGLEVAASQFGIRVPSGGSFGPPVYVELVRSRAILEPLSRDSVSVAEEGGRRDEIRKLLGVNPELTDPVISALRRMINPSEVKALGGVKITVATRWPSVSLAIAKRVVVGVNDFNLSTRRSQASAERVFVEAQSVEAEATLRKAEDAMQNFLEKNRNFGASPELIFQRDRLQRTVSLAQSSYTTLVLRKVEARIKEVRDTPLITVLEEPRLPLNGRSRQLALRGVLGALAVAAVLILIALIANAVAGVNQADPLVREFFDTADSALPQLLRRRKS